MIAPEQLPGFSVSVTLPVQWGDQDALGHVNNVVYFRWFESARIEYFSCIGLIVPGSAKSVAAILAAIHCDFRRPLTFPDTVHVGARVSRIGRSSMTMDYAVFSETQEEVVAEGTSTVVAFSYDTNAPAPVPEEARRAVEELEGKSL